MKPNVLEIARTGHLDFGSKENEKVIDDLKKHYDKLILEELEQNKKWIAAHQEAFRRAENEWHIDTPVKKALYVASCIAGVYVVLSFIAGVLWGVLTTLP